MAALDESDVTKEEEEEKTESEDESKDGELCRHIRCDVIDSCS